jgi:hypothetical protein
MRALPTGLLSGWRAALVLWLCVISGTGPVLASDDQAAVHDRRKEVDGEIQAVKREILEINEEILSLEEQMLYPHGQQLLVFLSLTGDSQISMGNVSLELDGKSVARHVYTRRETASLQKGGIQRLYSGRLSRGTHLVDVALSGAGTDGQPFNRQQSVKIVKGSDRIVIELNISAGNSRSEPEFTIHEW